MEVPMNGRTIFAAALAAVVTLTVATSASADVKVGPQHQLRVQFGTRGLDTASWNTGSDSPNDPNSRRLHAVVGHDEDTTDTQYSYLAFYSRASEDIGKAAGNVKNLSFEFREDGHVGAGAPRISVEFASGDIAYLSAGHCNHVMASSGNTWGRADFTRFLTNCSLFDNAGVEYAADGTSTAWQVYVAVHPDADVAQTFVVLDEEGTYNLDRISLGAGDMYQTAFGSAKHCTTESSC
jgi:hypothetical protein